MLYLLTYYCCITDSVKAAAGQLSPKTIARHSELLDVGDKIKDLFDT